MRIVSAKFLKSVLKLEDCPRDGRPEVAFVGRSNVGKSSLLNTLLGKSGLAKVSKTPGKTRTINFFDVNEKCYFVDLPGYGFAQAPADLKKEWSKSLTDYLTERESLKLVVLLLDSRHLPTEKDHDMLDLLDEAGVPTLLVATKVDKLKQSERGRLDGTLRTELELDPEAQIVAISSLSGEGKSDLLKIVGSLLF